MLKYIKSILVIVVPALLLAACNQAVKMDGDSGYLCLSVDKDTSPLTKAAEELGGDQTLYISIHQGETVIMESTEYTYSELSDEVFELPVGHYTVKAAIGDPSQVGWDAMCYDGATDVTVYSSRDNVAEIICGVSNAKITVDMDPEFENYFSSYQVYIYPEGREDDGLTYSNELSTLDGNGFFPVGAKILWKLSLVNADGQSYETAGFIDNIEGGKHYPLTFRMTEIPSSDVGFSAIKVVVDDSMTQKEYSATLDFSASGEIVLNSALDLSTIQFLPEQAPEVSFSVSAAKGIGSLMIQPSTPDTKSVSTTSWYELVGADAATIADLASIGIKVSSVAYGEKGEVEFDLSAYIAPMPLGEHITSIHLYDIHGNKKVIEVTVNVISDVEAVVVGATAWADAATLEAKWFTLERPAGFGIEYKGVDDAEWIDVDQALITYDNTNKRAVANISLAPNKNYHFRPYTDKDKDLASMNFSAPEAFSVTTVKPWGAFAVVRGTWNTKSAPSSLSFGFTSGTSVLGSRLQCNTDGTFVADICTLSGGTQYSINSVTDGNVQSAVNKPFKTETTSTIYNLSFDEWHKSGKVYYPYKEGASPTVWDSANEATSSFSGSTTVPETSHVISGTAVKMESRYIVIAFAAGNIYTGKFGTIQGKGAELYWGTPFSSRPVAMKGYYDYTSTVINRTQSPYGNMSGKPDQCQIQILLTDWEGMFTINTTEGKFVELDKDYIIAKGRYESPETTNGYKEFCIPLEYNDTDRIPTHVVISACSSYLGDYFTGGEGSTLYLDEFSLVYDVANLTDEQAAKVRYR